MVVGLVVAIGDCQAAIGNCDVLRKEAEAVPTRPATIHAISIATRTCRDDSISIALQTIAKVAGVGWRGISVRAARAHVRIAAFHDGQLPS